MARRGRLRDRQRRERQRGRRAAIAGRVVVVVVVVVVVTGMVVRGAAECTGGAMDMPVAVLVRRAMTLVVVMFLAAAVVATGAVGMALFTNRMRVIMIMIMIMIMLVVMLVVVAVGMRLRAARCGGLAMRVLAGRRRRLGDGGRIRIVRVGAARSGAAGMTVSWVVGTLGVGHDNLLNG
ncbi:hypothetical protein AAB992_23305 [Burkholderia contaminans]|nr:hypothetical protein [Burkholderia contaminans]WFN09553.1 hypothetical protein LXE92_15760 [Burkholderia contaminans]